MRLSAYKDVGAWTAIWLSLWLRWIGLLGRLGLTFPHPRDGWVYPRFPMLWNGQACTSSPATDPRPSILLSLARHPIVSTQGARLSRLTCVWETYLPALSPRRSGGGSGPSGRLSDSLGEGVSEFPDTPAPDGNSTTITSS